MQYDEAISTEIPLSRMLDALFDDSTPEEVVKFLRAWPDAFKDIIDESAYAGRIFQLDFFAAIPERDRIWLSDKLLASNAEYPMCYLFWQVMMHINSVPRGENVVAKLPCFAKLRRRVENYQLQLRHPYAGGHEHYVTEIDSRFLRLWPVECIARDVSSIPRAFDYIDYSLFAQRMLQADFFHSLTTVGKYMFLKDGIMHFSSQCLADGKVLRDFVIQVLESSEDMEVKKMLVREVRCNVWQPTFIDSKTLQMVHDCSCVEELLLKMAMLGNGLQQSLVVHLLMKKLSWLKSWAKTDPESLDRLLTISSFVDELSPSKYELSA